MPPRVLFSKLQKCCPQPWCEPYLAVALQDSHDGGLIFAARTGDLRSASAGVHIASFPADECFVCLDLAGQLVDSSDAQGVPDTVIHSPSGLLRNADSAVEFVGRYAILAGHNLPHSHQPFVDTEGRILKDGSSLRGELAGIVARAPLASAILLQESNVFAATARAFSAIRPAAAYQVFAAIGWVGKYTIAS